MKLVSKKGDLVAKNLGYSISYTDNESDTGEAENTNYESNDILGLEVTNDSVNAGYDYADEDKDENLSDLGKALKGSSKRLRSHYLFSLCIISRIFPLV